jgi:DNA repair exonuclease SbcCD ATPase subunit
LSEILLNQLIEKLDEVLLGRREIVSEIEKLKEALEKIQTKKKDKIGIQITNTVNEIKVFMSKSTNVLSELNNNMKNLQNLINSLNNIFDTLLNTKTIKESFKTHEFSPIPPKPEPLTRYESNMPTQIISQSESITPPPYVPEKPIETVGDSDFNLILSVAKSNNPAVEIATMLEKIRTKLENENPLNPILFELSMESRRLKSVGNVPLDAHNLQILIEKLNKWIG